MRHRPILALLATLLLALPATAAAAPEYEPNDGIHQAFGPLEADTAYDAMISSDDDVDWYVFYASGKGTIDVEVTALQRPNEFWALGVALRNHDGEELNSAGLWEGETDHIVYTTPGPGKYYVSLGGATEDRYRLTVSGPLTTGPRPGPAEMTPNDNQDMAAAFGPLAGGKLYGGSIDAYEEEDWFYFYTGSAGAFDVAVTGTGGDSFSARLRNEDGGALNSRSVYKYRVSHLRYTGAGRGKYYLQITGDPGDSYQLRIDPAGLISTAPLPPPAPPPAAAPAPKSKPKVAPACRRARKARRGVRRKLMAARRRAVATKKRSRAAKRPKVRRRARMAHRKWRRVAKKRRVVLRKRGKLIKARC